MTWWAAAALGLQAVGAAEKYFGAQDQASQMRAETDEELRRFRAEAERRVSLARAAGGASGIEFDSSSLQGHLVKMTSEFETQADWMRSAGYRRADAVSRAATFGLIGDLGSAAFSYGAANNWWRTPAAAPGGAP